MATPDEVFDHHLEVFGDGDMDGILSDYTEQTLMVYGDKTWRGLVGARDFFNMWLDELIPAGSKFDLTGRVCVDDLLYITWTAESAKYKFEFGTNTFLIRDGKVIYQTVASSHYRK
ncbi:MAG: nuclear transport factor 2 family protein [Pseudomonadota bacterium]